MYNHAPTDYICPLCITARGEESDKAMAKQADVIYRDELVFAMVNSKFSLTNPGHVVVVPNVHYEHLYDIPSTVGPRIFEVATKVSVAMKKGRKCDGVTILQLNEPAAGQHAFHYHMYIIPRFEDDGWGLDPKNYRVTSPEERAPYAGALRAYLK